ncbi:MAG: carbohydrate ABC transporter permease [Chloroflexota bacterium]|nr:MAG: carbohydrate ABC transporter permease [Chloroflexota bacterium]
MAIAATRDGAPARSRAEERRRVLATAATYAALVVCGVLFSFPFLWTLATSLKTGLETRVVPPVFLPEVVQWQNYLNVWTAQPLAQWFANSVVIIIATVPGAAVTATLVAYSFARFDFPLRDFWFMLMLSTLMLPYEVTLIPQYIIYQKYFGWVNTFWPLIVPSWVGGGAFTIFLLRQFLMTIPRDLDDAARVDGANSFQILWSILIPLCRPAIATVAILQFLREWNDFLGPFIYLNDPKLFTMSIGLRFFQTLSESTQEPRTHLLMTATILMSVPAIILFFSFQRYFVRGIVMTGLKG